MEIKYKNKVEDIELLMNFIKIELCKQNITYKFIFLIPIISGIYYSIERSNSIYFFIHSIGLNILTMYLVFVLLPKLSKKTSQRKALKLFNKDTFFSSEKKLIISNENIIVMTDDVEITIEINKNTRVYEVDKYIFIIVLTKLDYRYKLMIPDSSFKNEMKKREFIALVQTKTLD